MRYTSDSFARSCEQQQQQQQQQVNEEKDDEEAMTTGFAAVDEEGRPSSSLRQPMTPGLSIQVEGDENRMDEGGGKDDGWGGPGRERDGKGRVVVVEKWDAFTKQGHTSGDGMVNVNEVEDEDEVPADEVLPTDWRDIVRGRRVVYRDPPAVEASIPLPVLPSRHNAAGIGERIKPRLPMSDDLDEEIMESAVSPRDGSDGRADADADAAGTTTAATATTAEGEGIGFIAAALPNDWEDVGAKVSVYYLQQPAGEGGLFASTEESFRLDESFTMDPAAAAGAGASTTHGVSVRTVVLQIELLQEQEQAKPEEEEKGSHFDDAAAVADGSMPSFAAATTDDAAEPDAPAADDQLLPPPPAPKKSKILFIMHAKAPPYDDTSTSLATIEVSARSLFRDMLIRMLAAGTSSRRAIDNNNGFQSPPMSLLSPMAVTAMDCLNTSMLSLQSAQSGVESLDSLVAGADGWGTHPRHLYSLRMTLMDDDDDEIEEPATKKSQPSYFSPTRRKRDLSQSMVVTPLGLSSRAQGQGHTITQPHSQLRLMLVSPPKSPKKAPPNWGMFARRIQRLARRFLTLRHHSARLIQDMTRRRRLLRQWHKAVTDVWHRATTAILRIQRLTRRFLARCRVQARRDNRCLELERRIEQLVLSDIQVTHLPLLDTYITYPIAIQVTLLSFSSLIHEPSHNVSLCSYGISSLIVRRHAGRSTAMGPS